MEPNRKDRFRPAYLDLHEKGALVERGAEAQSRLECCRLCPRECKINRQAGRKGILPDRLEKPWFPAIAPISEKRTLWWNRGIGDDLLHPLQSPLPLLPEFRDQPPRRRPRSRARPAGPDDAPPPGFGCHNINFVSPSHVVAQILAALSSGRRGGPENPPGLQYRRL